MFYYKKKNNPMPDDLIVYPSMALLMKYEGITKNTYMFERKKWLIQTTYTVLENKWEFVRYIKGYIRFWNAIQLDNMSSAIKRKRAFTKKQ